MSLLSLKLHLTTMILIKGLKFWMFWKNIKYIERFKPIWAKAAGIVNLSCKFLKDGTDILARPISQLCNHSIKLNSFPRSCKIAKIKLLFKKGSKTDPQNYRPISWLPILSKTIEMVIHDQTQELLSKSKILYRFQHLSRSLLVVLAWLRYRCLSQTSNW